MKGGQTINVKVTSVKKKEQNNVNVEAEVLQGLSVPDSKKFKVCKKSMSLNMNSKDGSAVGKKEDKETCKEMSVEQVLDTVKNMFESLGIKKSRRSRSRSRSRKSKVSKK